MTRVRIRSLMAERANLDPAARINAGGTPYATTTWEGDVELEDGTAVSRLEAIFRLFNRVTDEDVGRLADLGYDLPSLSVGDIVELDGEAWRVASIGWEKLEQ